MSDLDEQDHSFHPWTTNLRNVRVQIISKLRRHIFSSCYPHIEQECSFFRWMDRVGMKRLQQVYVQYVTGNENFPFQYERSTLERRCKLLSELEKCSCRRISINECSNTQELSKLPTSVDNGDSGWGKFLWQNNDTSTLRLTSSTKQAFRNVGDGEE